MVEGCEKVDHMGSYGVTIREAYCQGGDQGSQSDVCKVKDLKPYTLNPNPKRA